MRTKREIEMEQMQKTLAQIDLIARDAIEHGGHEEDIDIGVFTLAIKKAEMQETLDQVELIARDAIQHGGHALALVNILRELQAHKERV